jgi:hypothetical protein
MKLLAILSTMVLWIIVMAYPAAGDPGRLYGKIYTTDDKVFEGAIRWDKNEASWDDILDGNKSLDDSHYKKYKRERKGTKRVTVFGVEIYREGDDEYYINWSNQAQSGIRMGHIKILIPDDDDRAILILQSGQKVEIENSSTDIGDGMRELLIDDKKEGVLEMFWDDIDSVVFGSTPGSEEGFGKRLYGKVATRQGETYTGFISWDVDEVFDTDILDGREDNHRRKIEFGRIKSIERRTSNSSLVTLKEGREMRLEDSNDIDSGNRGIAISDPSLGRIIVAWDEFDFVEFLEPPAGPSHENFDGGRKLHGTVYTEDGDKFTGDIKWDDDEEYSWELLDGKCDDVDFDIEFGFVKAIEKVSSRSSRVILNDGRSFKLKDSNDINSENKGIYINSGDDEIEVDWQDFQRVEFTK